MQQQQQHQQPTAKTEDAGGRGAVLTSPGRSHKVGKTACKGKIMILGSSSQ